MPRKVLSQWEFDDLLPAPPTRRVFTISEITGNIRRLLEKEVGVVWVTGEVTNLRTQSSGHIYFTLKDASAQLLCVLFRATPTNNREFLADGQKLLVNGELTVYEPRGQHQLIVRSVEPQGMGALQVAFERLKQKLQAEGLFATARKRPLPRYAQRIGLVTSPTGAAIRDVLHVVARRQPGLKIVLAPCRVQGDGAALEVAAAIRLLNEWHQTVAPGQGLDLILLTRGGGSLEDLWAFNEEAVARAVFGSKLPLVSAVGHEIDVTIADFVADVRAATPSAAAELITEGAFASRQFLARAAQRLSQLASQRIELSRNQLDSLTRRVYRMHPRRRMEEQMQRLDEAHIALVRCVRKGLRERVVTWTHLEQRLLRARPSTLLKQRREMITSLARRVEGAARQQLQDHSNRLHRLGDRLRLLSPDSVLARGYSVTIDTRTGTVVRDAGELRKGQHIKTRLKRGEVTSVVEQTSEHENRSV
jgi:exodeoxyribonuclease VII large subunit